MRRKFFGVVVSVALLAPEFSLAQTWINVTAGTHSWATPGNWLGGVVPISSPSTALYFGNTVQAGTITATAGAGTFFLNRITVDSEATLNPFAVLGGSAFGANLEFAGADPSAIVTGTGRAQMRNFNFNPAATVTVRNLGIGKVTLGAFNGTTIVENAFGGIVTSESGGGTLILQSGDLEPRSTTTAHTIVNGGRVMIASDAFIVSFGTFTLNAPLHIAGFGNSLTFNSSLVGPAGVRVRHNSGGSTLTFAADNSFSGPFEVTPIRGLGVVNLNGVSRFSGSSSVRLDDSSLFIAPAAIGSSVDRLPNSAPISLNRGALQIRGTTDQITAETAGTLSFTGQSQIAVNTAFPSSSTGNTQFTFAALNRVQRGLLYVGTTDASLSFGGTPGTSMGNMFVTAAPTDALVGGIIPWAMANSGTTTGGGRFINASLVGYDATRGMRPLAGNEYQQYLYRVHGSDAVTLNVSNTSIAGLTGTTRVNALLQTATNITPCVYGSGTLQLASGLLAVTSGSINNTRLQFVGVATIDFGAREGIISSAGQVHVASTLAGQNGLTLGGGGTVQIAGHNTFSGPVTLNGGTVFFSADDAFGAPANSIQLNNGQDGALYFAESTYFSPGNRDAVQLNRAIHLGPAGGSIGALNPDGTLTLVGTIQGDAPLRLVGGGNIALRGENLNTGPTVIATSFIGINSVFSRGAVSILNDAALGPAGSELQILGGQLRMDAPDISIHRPISALGAEINTRHHAATIDGIIASGPHVFNSLRKVGSGTLTLTASNTFSGSVLAGGSFSISGNPTLGNDDLPATTAGTIRLSGAEGALAAAESVSIYTGASMVLDNSLGNNNNRLGTSTLLLSGGRLVLHGNKSSPTTEQIGTIMLDTGHSRIDLLPADQFLTLHATGVSRPLSSSVLVSGASLGSAASLKFFTAPSLSAGVVPGWFTQPADGSGSLSFATYDSASGLRPLTDAEFVPLPQSGTITQPVDLSGAQTQTGSVQLSVLRMRDASLNLNGKSLQITGSSILGVGTAASSITNGALHFGSGTATAILHHTATLTIGASLGGVTTLNKSGPGTLVLTPSISAVNALNLAGGRTILGAAALLQPTALTVNPAPDASAGTLDLNGNALEVSAIQGFGAIELSGGTLTLLTNASATFAGSMRGAGALVKAGSALNILSGDLSALTGTIHINSGTLRFDSSVRSPGIVALGLPPAAGGAAATLSFGATVQEFARDIVVQGPSNNIGVAIEATNSVELTGNISLERYLRLTGANSPDPQAATIRGNISGPGSISFDTGGLWNLYGHNSYTGGTRFNLPGNYTIGFIHSDAFGSGPMRFSPSSSGTLRPDAPNLVIANSIEAEAPFSSLLIGFTGVYDLQLSGPIGPSPTFRTFGTAPVTLTGSMTNVGGFRKQGGGTLVFAGSNQNFSNVFVDAGVLQINNRFSAGTLQLLTGSIVAMPTTGQPRLTVGSLSMSFGSGIDIGNGVLYWAYDEESTIPNLSYHIRTAFAGGAWTGEGIGAELARIDALAPQPQRLAVGYVEAHNLFNTFPAVFLGEHVDATTAIARLTLSGDANLDRIVNITDFALLAANFNLVDKLWYGGDFNYDYVTNIADFALLAANFNQALPDNLPRTSNIPEPVSTTLLLLTAAINCQCRRWRLGR